MRRTAILALVIAFLGFPPSLTAAKETDTPAPSAAEETTGILLDLNSAGHDELLSVRGIGPVLAERIIDYRSTHGPFARLEELLHVKGIGEKSLARLRKYFTVSPPPSPEASPNPSLPR